jgi:multiple sugar transport system substrate-binding protein
MLHPPGKNVAVAKDFLKYLIQPQVLNGLLKTGLGRNLPAMPAIVKNDPWWLDPKDPHRVTYVRQGLFGPTVPTFWTSNPAYRTRARRLIFDKSFCRASPRSAYSCSHKSTDSAMAR